MKVRIDYTVEVSDEYREAIREYYGLTGRASREEIVKWFRTHGETMDQELIAEYRARPGWDLGRYERKTG